MTTKTWSVAWYTTEPALSPCNDPSWILPSPRPGIVTSATTRIAPIASKLATVVTDTAPEIAASVPP